MSRDDFRLLFSKSEHTESDFSSPYGRDDPEAAGDNGPSFQPIRVAVGNLAVRIAQRAKLLPQCESPIEADLGASILLHLGHILEPAGLTLQPQFRFDRFRWDFAILKAGKAVLLIECDGKEFHSSPERIANDRRKNLCAAAAHIPLLRFTGSEIFRFADGCTHRVLEQLVISGAVR
jgi:very-short-patch-repair endonuclease